MNKVKTKSINLTPTWKATAHMLLLVIEKSSSNDDKAYARKELLRMGNIIDQLTSTDKGVSIDEQN